MGIFRRGTKDNSAELSSDTTATEGEDLATTDEGSTNAATSPPPGVGRSGGPFDRSEVGGLEGRLDLGSLWLTGLPGMELRVEQEEESEALVGVTAVLGESAVQLQAFAAPRSEGIWDEIRTEIAASITSSGGTADKTSGPLGAELQARMPGQGPDGRPVVSPVRFVGVDGPRWFLRAVLSGPAALDEEAAGPLIEVVRATVVVRGAEAMAPRELLPLKLPEVLDPAGQDAADAHLAGEDTTDEATTDEGLGGKAAPAAGPSLDDLKPFERGPEISEVR